MLQKKSHAPPRLYSTGIDLKQLLFTWLIYFISRYRGVEMHPINFTLLHVVRFY